VAFLATALRFMPRDASGRRRLPRIIDQSVGMYLMRRLLGGSVDVVEETDLLDEPPSTGVPASAGLGAGLAAGGGFARSPRPTMPSRFVVSRSNDRSRLVARPVFPGLISVRPPAVRGARTRPASALALQRRIAGAVAVAIVAIVAVLGVAIGPHTFDGAALSATGTPAPPSATPTTAPTSTLVSTVAPTPPPAAP
jgi:hypothetical protein